MRSCEERVECPLCGRKITKINITKHLRSHETHPDDQEWLLKAQHLDHEDLFCKYCGKECKNKNSLIQHEIRCKDNPDSVKISPLAPRVGFNNKGRVAWNKGLTKETSKSIARSAQKLSLKYSLGLISRKPIKLSEKAKERIRQKQLDRCAKSGTNLCGKGLRGWYKGYYCQSSWELAFVLYSLDLNTNIVRNKEGFSYIWKGVKRTYFPDFYDIDHHTYIEVKGYYDERSKEKIKQFPKDKHIRVLCLKEMTPILDYVISKYGKNYVDLYDKNV